MALRLIAYIRVSSKTQTDNTSFESQAKAVANFCTRFDHELIDIRRETFTASGARKRVVFQAALDDIINGAADGLVVCRLDRFARSTLEGLQVATSLKAHKKELLVVDLGFDTSTPIGSCILSVLLSFAELERKMIATRVEEGKKRVKEGGYFGGGHPYYGWRPSGSVGKRKLKPVPQEQEVLRYIFELHNSGASFKQIARELNTRGIATYRGGPWHQSTIGDIIRRNREVEKEAPEMVASLH